MSCRKVANAELGNQYIYNPPTESESLKSKEPSSLSVTSRKAKDTSERRSLPHNKMMKLFPLLIVSIAVVSLAAPHKNEIQGLPDSEKLTALERSEIRETTTRQIGTCLPLGSLCSAFGQCCLSKSEWCIFGVCRPCNGVGQQCGGANGVLGPCCSGLYCIRGQCKACVPTRGYCGVETGPCCSGNFRCYLARCR